MRRRNEILLKYFYPFNLRRFEEMDKLIKLVQTFTILIILKLRWEREFIHTRVHTYIYTYIFSFQYTRSSMCNQFYYNNIKYYNL